MAFKKYVPTIFIDFSCVSLPVANFPCVSVIYKIKRICVSKRDINHFSIRNLIHM